MNKKKGLWIGLGALVIVVIVIVYRWYVADPASFPEEKMVVASINQVSSEIEVSEIQDVMEVSERKRFVPFITEQNNYGKSLWVWRQNKWQLENIELSGEPKLWKVDVGDPSTYHYIWNINPEDSTEEIEFYLIRQRNYHITNGVDETYQPRIQMKEVVTLENKRYGVLSMPDGWSAFMQSLEDTQPQSNALFSSFFHNPFVRFGWRPVNARGEYSRPDKSMNGSSFGGEETWEFLMPVDSRDIEVPVGQN